MDIVYILGKGSNNANLEILYSIRSVQKYVNHDRIFIVGEKPTFFNYSDNLIHIPHENEQTGKKNYHIAKRIEFVCKQPMVSDDFFFFNDDYFITKKINPTTYPNYHKGELTIMPKNSYDRILLATRQYLKSLGYNYLHFDVHTPVVYNKKKFLEIAHHFTSDKELVVKSMYGNVHNIKGKFCNDHKIRKPESNEVIAENRLFSTYDELRQTGLLKFINSLYPDSSSHERPFNISCMVLKSYRDKHLNTLNYKGKSVVLSLQRYLDLINFVKPLSIIG